VRETAERPGASALERLARRPLDAAQKLAAALPAAVEGYFADRCPQFAAGISYRVLFSLAPLAIVLVSIFGLVLQDDQLRGDVVQAIVDVLPVSEEGSRNVEDAITRIATPASAFGLLSLVVFGWAASGMMAAIRSGLEAAMGVEQSRPAARNKLIDFALVIGAAALVVATVLLNLAVEIVLRAVDRWSERLGVDGAGVSQLFRHGVPFVISVLIVMLLYRFVPARRLRFRDALAGALVTALLLLAISLASGFIFDRTARLSVVYGSLTAALVFLYSVYLYASALLFGAEFASAWARPPTGPGEPVLVQLRRAVVGLFVHQRPPEEHAPRQQAPAGVPPRRR
jgi:membrane protein